METGKDASGYNIGDRSSNQKRNRRYLLLLSLLSVLTFCTGIGIYAFLALNITKVDVSGPEPDGYDFIVPENYQNLLVLDVTIPAFDAGRIGEDVKLHNGVSGSNSRDILRPFDLTDWYSDHDGDASFDGNTVSGNTEAIVSSSNDILDSSDTVKKTGLCFIESFTYSAGIGEQHVDSNHSDSYTGGEAVLRTSTSPSEVHSGEVIRSGTADMTSFPAAVRFTDGISGSVNPAQYNSGEAIISSSDTTLDSGDTILTAGNADMEPFPANIMYSDSISDNQYGDSEAIISDAGVQGQLDAGALDGTGIDTVIGPGLADLRAMDGDLLFADDNRDDEYTNGELLVGSSDLNVDSGEVKLSGSANLKPMTNLAFADDNNDNQLDPPELIINNTGIHADILESADTIASPGNADLKSFADGSEQFVDNSGNGLYNDGECIIRNGDGTANLLSTSDVVVKPGPAFLTAFDTNNKWADVNNNNQYDDQELIVNSPDDTLEVGEVVKPGYCNLKLIFPGQVYSDDNNNGLYSSDELLVDSSDTTLDASDTVITPGKACLLSFGDSSSTWYVDTDKEKDFDSDESIINEGNGDNIPYLDASDSVARAGTVDIRSFEDETVFIDHSGNGNFQGDSDNDVNLDDSDDTTFANDPDVINDQDEVVLTDPVGARHLALDAGDTVLRPGMALLTAFPATDMYVDDGDNAYDGDSLPEAIVRDNNSDQFLDEADIVLATGTALIRDFSPPQTNKYIDANNDEGFTIGETVILDSGPGGIPNGLLDAGALNGTGTDQVITPGLASLTAFARAEKFVDASRNGAYESGEAIVYDWYKADDFEGEYILAGDTTSPIPGTGVLTYQAPGSRIRDSVLLSSGVGSAAIIQFNSNPAYKYIDDSDTAHDDVYNGFYYRGTYEPIIWSDNAQLEEGDLDGSGTDHLLAAGYAAMRPWTGNAENIAWADDNHDGNYQSNEAIVNDDSGDGIITSIGTSAGQDQVVVSGDAHLNELEEMKYVDANNNNVFNDGAELKINDVNRDNMIQDSEIEDSGPIPFLKAFTSASTEYRYCDSNGNTQLDLDEAVVMDLNTVGTLEAGDEVVTSGTLTMQNFNAATDRYADSDHNAQYDYNTSTGFGDAIVVNTTGNIGEVEISDTIESDGYADLQTLSIAHKYADDNANNEFTNGELIVEDLNSDDNVDSGEIIRSGLANLKSLPADVMYTDDNGDSTYSSLEAIIHTSDTNLGSDDEVLSSGLARLHSFETNTYRFADANHNDTYNQNEAIIAEESWGAADDILEDSDIIILAGEADIEPFPSASMFLDDGTNSDAYEDGEAIVYDSNSDGILDPGEIVTGGRAALRSFAGGERYTDGGNGVNARNSQYDPDEAIIRDGNYNGELDSGALDGSGNDEVLLTGRAGLTQFDSDGLPNSPNCDDEHYVDSDGNNQYDGNEDIYQDKDNNNMVTIGDDALEYFAVENFGTATNSDISDVELWADRDGDGQFEPDGDDAPSVTNLVPDASNTKLWYEGPAISPPLSTASGNVPIDYAIQTDEQRFFVTVDIGNAPTDGHNIQMSLPLNGAKTIFGLSGPSDASLINAYIQRIDFANPSIAVITMPTDGEILYGQIDLQANASDAIQIGMVEFYDGAPGGSPPIAVDSDGPPWAVSWDSSGVELGSHTLYARVYDRAYLRPPQTWGINHYIDSPGVTITIAISYEIQLFDGWNLISLPVEPFDTSVGSVMSLVNGSCTAFWSYDAPALEWPRYDLDDPEFLRDLDEIHMGIGYWILMDGPGTLNIYGGMPGIAISLRTGWNLVGFNSLTPINIVDATSSIAFDFEVWTVDPETGNWLSYIPGDPLNDLDTMNPGRGYWIYVSADCIWDISE